MMTMNFPIEVVSILVGVILIWWQIRTQNKLTSAQLYVSLEERYNDENHRQLRRLTAQSVIDFLNGSDVSGLPGRIPIFSMLETCGELSMRRIMNYREINADFGYYTFGYVYAVTKGRSDVNFFARERTHQSDAWIGMESIALTYIRVNRLDDLDHETRLAIAKEALEKELLA